MTKENCYQLFESELNRSATSLSTAAQYRQTCSKLIQFGLKKLVAIFVRHSTALVNHRKMFTFIRLLRAVLNECKIKAKEFID